MARPVLMEAPVLVTLPADEGLTAPVNCERCAGGLTIEGKSRGREDVGGACRNVSAVVYCKPCNARWRLDVVLTPIPGLL